MATDGKRTPQAVDSDEAERDSVTAAIDRIDIDGIVSQHSDAVRSICREYLAETVGIGTDAAAELGVQAAADGIDQETLMTALATLQASVIESVSDEERSTVAAVIGADIGRIGAGHASADRPAFGDTLEAMAADVEGIRDSTFEIETLADQQSGNVKQITDEIGDLSASVEEIAATADGVNENSDRATELADTGHEEARSVAERMEEIHEGTTRATEEMESLRDQTDEIDRVVELINDIADETNILALNASIEAARAETGGEGFAVVADEVKSLAEESKRHAEEIEDLVGGVQTGADEVLDDLQSVENDVSEGLERADRAGETFEEIVDAVDDVSEGLDQVANVTNEQAATTEEIAAMLDESSRKADRISNEIETIAESNVEHLETIRETSDQLD